MKKKLKKQYGYFSLAYTKEQQKQMRKLDNAKKKYASEVWRIIRTQVPKKHRQIVWISSENVGYEISMSSFAPRRNKL